MRTILGLSAADFEQAVRLCLEDMQRQVSAEAQLKMGRERKAAPEPG